MLQIYDDQHRRIAGIDDPDDLKIEKTLSSGDKQISFSYPKTGSEIENLRAEYYIRTKDDEYVLKEPRQRRFRQRRSPLSLYT